MFFLHIQTTRTSRPSFEYYTNNQLFSYRKQCLHIVFVWNAVVLLLQFLHLEMTPHVMSREGNYKWSSFVHLQLYMNINKKSLLPKSLAMTLAHTWPLLTFQTWSELRDHNNVQGIAVLYIHKVNAPALIGFHTQDGIQYHQKNWFTLTIRSAEVFQSYKFKFVTPGMFISQHFPIWSPPSKSYYDYVIPLSGLWIIWK